MCVCVCVCVRVCVYSSVCTCSRPLSPVLTSLHPNSFIHSLSISLFLTFQHTLLTTRNTHTHIDTHTRHAFATFFSLPHTTTYSLSRYLARARAFFSFRPHTHIHAHTHKQCRQAFTAVMTRQPPHDYPAIGSACAK